MSNHTHLLTELRAGTRKAAASKRAELPYARLSKAQLWERLQAAEKALLVTAINSSRLSRAAHGYLQAQAGPARYQMAELRDRSHTIRDAARAAVRS